MLSFKSYLFTALSILALGWLSSCSTEKDAPLNVGYHNMTARYNGYHNARVIMEEALQGYRDGAIEDYNKILPLDLYPTKEDVPMIQENYEDALGRCETVIQRHSMPSSQSKNKSVEHCRWIDDNWFVIGVIHYTRQEYIEALEIFSFLDESPMYVDQERVHEARIWLAKTYIAMGRYPEAKRILSQVEVDMESAESSTKEKKPKESKRQKKRRKAQEKKDKKNGVKKPVPFPKNLKDDYELTMAEFYIAQGEYKQAIPHLEKGIEMTKKRKKKARYMFVLAQLYQKLGNGQQAAFFFNKVSHSNAPYEMRFQASIQKALSSGAGDDELKDDLKKMLKDSKNEEYKDQIYFALAEMEMKAGNKEQAIQYYSQSAFYSIKNDRQKGVSYLKLGDIYFNDKDYLSAQKYYDSCVQVLPEDYETYKQIQGKADGLSDLVLHYETYVFEDSVQRKAQMSPEELDKYLEQQIVEMREAEKKRKEEEERRLKDQQNRIKNSNLNSGSGSKWYFYNQKVSSSGFNDFRALWGQRTLEDDWRRSTKTSFNFDPDNPDAEDSLDLADNSDSLTVDMLKANLPLTPEAMDSSNNKLMNALYMLGIIYKEQLKEDNEAIHYFELIVNRGVEHPKVLPAMYQLYLLYKKKGSPKANGYKETILKDYADSEIAMILLDPDYLKKKQEREQEELNEYSNTFEDYRYGRYTKVIRKCDEVITNDTTNQYLNKYYLLKAFAIGRSRPGNQNLVRDPLQKLYTMSPNSEEGKEAKFYLDKLDNGLNIVQPDTLSNNTLVNNSPYIYDEGMEHYFILHFPADAGSINATEIKISNFCKEFFRSKQLTVKKVQFGADQMIIVQTFSNQQESKDFFQAFDSPTARTTLGRIAMEYEHFLINSENFKELMRSTNLGSYKTFYQEQYPQ